MASQVHDHIHLYNVTLMDQHDESAFHVALQSGIQRRPVTAAQGQRSLTGALNIHALADAYGTVLKFRDGNLGLLATPAELTMLDSLSGLTCQYIPHEHDDALELEPWAAQGYQALFKVESSQNIDPMLGWWNVVVSLMEDEI